MSAPDHRLRVTLGGLAGRSIVARPPRAPLVVVAVALALVVGAVASAEALPVAFVALGLGLVALAGYAAFRWPRSAIVAVILTPVVDRYVVGDALPRALEAAAHYLSEGLLLAVGVVIALRAAREGYLLAALRHPTLWALLAFAGLGATSAVVNGVPPHVAAIGLLFTLDAALLFFLPRMTGFTLRQSLAAVAALAAVVVVAALVAVAQALLSPRILGLDPVPGRFGELHRLGSIFGDPNVFGAFLVTITPFALLIVTTIRNRRVKAIAAAVAFLLVLALWLSFSRGSWIAVILGVGTILALVDRRAVAIGLLACVVTFGVAVAMPRDLLEPQDAGARPELIDSTIDRFGTIGGRGDLRTLFVLNALPIAREHPVLGVGPGRFGGAVADNLGTPIYEAYGTDRLFTNPLQRTVDNFWLHILVESGIVGFLALVAAALIPGLAVLHAARRAAGWRRVLLGGVAAATAGIVVSSLTTMMLEANAIGFVFWFLLGIGSLAVRALPRERVPSSS